MSRFSPPALTKGLSAMAVSVALSLAVPGIAQGGEVTVFAAASTKPVIDALTQVLAERGVQVRTVHAASSTLARQIEHGAAAHVFVSANVAWMDYLDARDLLHGKSRTDVAVNRLAIITGPGARTKTGLMEALGDDGRLALADPAHVPAGLYAREALTNLGYWDALQDRLAPTKDVTGALILVSRGEAPVGIVYVTDASRAQSVEILDILPSDSHSSITYQAAIVAAYDTPDARSFMEVLTGAEGQSAFNAAGFGRPQ